MAEPTIPINVQASAQIYLYVVFLLVACAIQSGAASKGRERSTGGSNSWILIPGQSAGPITATTTVSELQKWYGYENVVSTGIDVGEGMYEPGVILFPNDQRKHAELVLDLHAADSDRHAEAQFKSFTLRCTSCVWATANSITIGTDILELEKLNGLPFILSGFGWDGGGGILSWRCGRLANKSPWLGVYFEGRSPSPSEMEALRGDRPIRSDGPILRKYKLSVDSLSMSFVPPAYVPARLMILQPRGNPNWPPGSSQTIEWVVDNAFPGSYLKPPQIWRGQMGFDYLEKKEYPMCGSVVWTIPADIVQTDTYHVKIEVIGAIPDHKEAIASADAPFTIFRGKKPLSIRAW